MTSRVIGLGSADGNVGYGAPRDPDEAWAMRQHWCSEIGLDAETLVAIWQVHGTDVAVATAADAGKGARRGSGNLGYADAIVTNEPGVSLITLHADCLPILLYDPEIRATAAIHAGWRGTVAGVVDSTVRKMQELYGLEPSRTIAFLGPTNRGCCYEVGGEVAEAWLLRDPDDDAGALRPFGEKWKFDVSDANRWTLRQLGFKDELIERSEICTQCSESEWFCHRAQGPHTGRFGAIIGLVSSAGVGKQQ
jgi:YfiH family protein